MSSSQLSRLLLHLLALGKAQLVSGFFNGPLTAAAVYTAEHFATLTTITGR